MHKAAVKMYPQFRLFEYFADGYTTRSTYQIKEETRGIATDSIKLTFDRLSHS